MFDTARRALRPALLVLAALAVLHWPDPARGAFVQTLSNQAQAALVQGRLPLAAVLLKGAWEVSKDPKILLKMAQVHAMAGQFAEAIEQYQRLIKLAPGGEMRKHARAEIRRLRAAPAPFSDELLTRTRATPQARRAFALGLGAARRRKSKRAIRYLRAALVLDPTLPGTYRVLGAVHGRLKNPKLERAFLEDYLRIRPDGPIADKVRRRLKPTGVLAPVKLVASFPCDVWVNGRRMDRRTPVKELLLPAGGHTVSFVNARYHIIRNVRVRLARGKPRTIQFEFGVLVAQLRPWARIRANGRDLGLWDEIGLPTGRYRLRVTAHDESRTERLEVTIRAGKRTRIKPW